MDWILENKEWIFSGVGVFAIGIIISIFRKKNKSPNMVQKSGKNSTNYQSGGDMKIN